MEVLPIKILALPLVALALAFGAPGALGSFGAPVDVSVPGQDALDQQVAAEPDGGATAVWIRSDGSSYIVQTASRAAGATGFSSPVDLSEPGRSAWSPQVAVGPDGSATAVWRRSNGTNDVIQVATRAAGATSFGAPVDISPPGTDAYDPQIAIGPDGTATIVWYRWDGTYGTVQTATRAAGAASFSAPADISVFGQTAFFQQIAVGPDGTTTVVWRRYNGANWIIQAATRAAGALGFGAPEDLSATGRDATRPEVAMGSGGLTTVVWQRSNGSNTIVQAATRAVGAATFGAPEDLSAAGQDAEVPQVAIGVDGAITAVWRRIDAGPTQSIIQVATRAAGAAGFGAPADLSPAGQFGFDPKIAVDPDGSATAVWSLNGSSYIIQTATRAAGSAVFGAVADLSPSGWFSNKPQIAIGPDGSATVAWFSNATGSPPYAIQASTSPPTLARVSVTREGAGSGSVSSAPSGIDCGSTCAAFFRIGSSVTLTATPAAGSSFAGWGGACAGTATTCTVSVAAATSVRAAFSVGTTSASANPLRATIDANRRVVVRGDTLRLRIRVANAGVLPATSVRSCLRIPAGLTFVRARGGVRSGRTVCFALGDLAAGATRTSEVIVRAVSARPAVRQVTGSARSASATPGRVAATPLTIRIRLSPATEAVTG